MNKLKWVVLFSMLTNLTVAQHRAFEVDEDVRIAMRDGIVLRGHLSRPKVDRRVPVILRINSYAREKDLSANRYVFQLAANLGYAYAEINIRGTGKSEGERHPFEHDVTDGYDIIDWLSKQSWCDGAVVMGGGSYLGYTQWAALKNPHPALKTIVPMVAAAPGKDMPSLNGMMPNYMMRWMSTFDSPYANDASFDDTERWRKIYNTIYCAGLPTTSIDSLHGRRSEVFQQWLQHPAFDEFWSSKLPSSAAEYRNINIPILSITGFFDSNQRGALYYYNMHTKSNPQHNHYLLIGPYDHATGQNQKHLSRHHYYRFDTTAYVNKVALAAKWYNHVLKNEKLPEQIKDKVNVFVIGDGWRYAKSLGDLAADTIRFHLGEGVLSKQVQRKSKSALPFDSRVINDTLTSRLTYRTAAPFNHTDEFSTVVDGNENYLNQTPILVFDSPKFDRAFDLIGSPVGVMNMSVKGIKDADVEVRYYEVTTEGKSYELSVVAQRLSLIDDKRSVLLDEGRVREFHFDNAYFMAKRIAKGSFVRVTVRIINEAGFQKNYGSGKNVSTESIKDAKQGALNIHFGRKGGSSILLPGKFKE
ncbi:CocE/NonD family hydrolase [Pseudochryseolinea flava]|uniref:Xaa-Pro dipeptidyl-peptidase-like domain-containing protein n=1 Tax=Pseudochryseolinea flava TaxID=2059302 RepID=A0A364Y7S8_9BACT|nr:CocE/NonD family hydrolase [Pseudochryseolinea flava]RAW02184.1 hypothetical protein DQQ10_06485 [Pseudochryseolinea flava]